MSTHYAEQMEAQKKAHKQRMEQDKAEFYRKFDELEQAMPRVALHKRRRFCFCPGECTCRLSVAEEGMYHAFLNEQQLQYTAECEYIDEQFADYFRRKRARGSAAMDCSGEPSKKRVATAPPKLTAKAARAVAAAEHDDFVRRCQHEAWFLKISELDKAPAPVQTSKAQPEPVLKRGLDGVLRNGEGIPVTPLGDPFILTCHHGVTRMKACGQCGGGPTWATVTRPARMRELQQMGRLPGV